MNLPFIFNRIKNLIFSPVSEWQKINTENHNKTSIVNQFALPLIIIMSLCTIVGNAIFASRLIFSVQFVIAVALAKFTEAFIGLHISAKMVNELTTSFNSKKDIHHTYALVVYSLSVYFAVSALAYLFLGSYLEVLKVFGLYSFYLLWLGAAALLATPNDNKVGFVVVSALVILGVFSILTLMIDKIIAGIFHIQAVS